MVRTLVTSGKEGRRSAGKRGQVADNAQFLDMGGGCMSTVIL